MAQLDRNSFRLHQITCKKTIWCVITPLQKSCSFWKHLLEGKRGMYTSKRAGHVVAMETETDRSHFRFIFLNAGLNPHLHRRQELNCLSHHWCLLGSRLAWNWNQTQGSNMGCRHPNWCPNHLVNAYLYIKILTSHITSLVITLSTEYRNTITWNDLIQYIISTMLISTN